MKTKDITILNKCGALTGTELRELFERIEKLEEKIRDYRSAFLTIWIELYGGNEYNKRSTWNFFKNISVNEAFKKEALSGKNSILKKFRALTHADDYEYVTETRLVKKNKKENEE